MYKNTLINKSTESNIISYLYFNIISKILQYLNILMMLVLIYDEKNVERETLEEHEGQSSCYSMSTYLALCRSPSKGIQGKL